MTCCCCCCGCAEQLLKPIPDGEALAEAAGAGEGECWRAECPRPVHMQGQHNSCMVVAGEVHFSPASDYRGTNAMFQCNLSSAYIHADMHACMHQQRQTVLRQDHSAAFSMRVVLTCCLILLPPQFVIMLYMRILFCCTHNMAQKKQRERIITISSVGC